MIDVKLNKDVCAYPVTLCSPESIWSQKTSTFLDLSTNLHTEIVHAYIKENKSGHLKAYIDAHDESIVQVNRGQSYNHQRRCSFAAVCRSVEISGSTGIFIVISQTQAEGMVDIGISDPNEKFIPSAAFITQWQLNKMQPSDELNESFNDLKAAQELGDENQDMSSILSEQIENLFASWAIRMSSAGHIKITEHKRFISNISNEISERLDLDVYSAKPILDSLYQELLEFVALVPRTRSWGTISLKEDEIALSINDHALSVVRPDDIPRERWTTT